MKLSKEDIDHIKDLHKKREHTQQEIAGAFGVSQGNISRVVNDRVYKYKKKRWNGEYPRNFNFMLSNEMHEQLGKVTEVWNITRGEFIRRAVDARLRLRLKEMEER